MNTLGPVETFQNFAPPPEQKARDSLGQEDFLTLMISQFRNQDPFEPMDNGEFLGQLAQFSTVNGISSLNAAFAGLAGSMQDNQALQAAGLVGHSVLAVTDIAYLDDEQSLKRRCRTGIQRRQRANRYYQPVRRARAATESWSAAAGDGAFYLGRH